MAQNTLNIEYCRLVLVGWRFLQFSDVTVTFTCLQSRIMLQKNITSHMNNNYSEQFLYLVLSITNAT